MSATLKAQHRCLSSWYESTSGSSSKNTCFSSSGVTGLQSKQTLECFSYFFHNICSVLLSIFFRLTRSFRAVFGSRRRMPVDRPSAENGILPKTDPFCLLHPDIANSDCEFIEFCFTSFVQYTDIMMYNIVFYMLPTETVLTSDY